MWQGDWTSIKEETVKLLVCTHHSEDNIKYLLELSESSLMKIAWYTRVRVLDPFLYFKPYSLEQLTDWALDGKLLPHVRCINPYNKINSSLKDAIILCDTIAYYTTQIIQIFLISGCGVCRNFQADFNKKCEELKNYTLEQCISYIQNDEIFILLQKHLPESSDVKMSAAALLITYIICNEALKISDEDEISNFEDYCVSSSEVEFIKELGNEEYQHQNYYAAIDCYSKAIEANHHVAVLYGNRAQAYLKLDRCDEAEMDGRRALVLRPDWCKAYYRLAQIFESREELHKAQAVCQFGLYKCKSDKHLPFQSSIYEDLELYNKNLSYKCTLASKSNSTSKKKENEKQEVNVRQETNEKQPRGRKMHKPDDVPELTDPSNSEDSDSSTSVTSNKKAKLHQKRRDSLKEKMKEGSAAALACCYDVSVNCFNKALEKIKNEEFPDIDETELVSLKFSYGMACIESYKYENLKKGISVFNEILENHKDVRCPAAYYGLGMAYFRMNDFKTALATLKAGLSIVEKGIRYTPQIWPCSTNVIQDTQPGKLEKMFQKLISKCQHPPPPDAVCRYKECTQNTNIYYSDPGFKGFVITRCQQHCYVTYHPVCWKELKDVYSRTDKEFIEQNCLTPDCEGLIIHVEVIGQNGSTTKQFINETSKKFPRHRKSKLEKRMEQKELRKKRRIRDHTVERNSISEPQEPTSKDTKESTSEDTANVQIDCAKNESKTSNVNSKTPVKKKVPIPTESSHPLHVLKKEDNEVESATTSKKEKKKSKVKNIMSLDEFCGDSPYSAHNEYKKRLGRLQKAKEMAEDGYWSSFPENHLMGFAPFDPQNPFYSPDNLQNNPEALEVALQSNARNGTYDTTLDIKDNIFSYMEGILKCEGPVHKDDPLLTEELRSFPVEAQQLISDCGGLINFLLQSIKFAVVKDYICVSSDVLKTYKLTSSTMALKFSSENSKSDDEECYFSPEEEISEDKLNCQIEDNTNETLSPNYNFTSTVALSNDNLYHHYSKDYSQQYYDGEYFTDRYNNGTCLDIVQCGDGQYEYHSHSLKSINNSLNNENLGTAQPYNISSEVTEYLNFTEKPHDYSDNSKINVSVDNDGPASIEASNIEELKSSTKCLNISLNRTQHSVPSKNCMAVDLKNVPHTPKHNLSITRSLLTGNVLHNILKKMFYYLQNNKDLLVVVDDIPILQNCNIKILPGSKINKYVQTGPSLQSFTSVGIMKEDDELKCALRRIEQLTRQNKDSEAELTLTLDTVSNIESKYKVEINCYKKEVESIRAELLKEQSKAKTLQINFEKERNQRQLSHTKIAQELKICQKELQKKIDELKLSENQANILADLNQGIQNELKAEKNAKNELQETLGSVMKMCDKHCEIAEIAKLELLSFKRNEAFMQKERALRYSEANIQQLRNTYKDGYLILAPVFVKAIEEWTAYKNEADIAYSLFLKTVDEHIASLENGVNADTLPHLNMPSICDPPVIPSVTVPFMLPGMTLPNFPSTSAKQNFTGRNISMPTNLPAQPSTQTVSAKKAIRPHPPGLDIIIPDLGVSVFEKMKSDNIQEKDGQTPVKTLGSGYDLDDFDKLPSENSNQADSKKTPVDKLSCDNIASTSNAPHTMKASLEKLPCDISDQPRSRKPSLEMQCDTSNQPLIKNLSVHSSLSEIPQQINKSSEKVLTHLRKHCPDLNDEQLTFYLKSYRTKQGKLTGMTISSIIDGVKELVEKDYANQTGARPRPRVTSQIKKLSQLPSSFSRNEDSRMNDIKREEVTKAWGTVTTHLWSGEGADGSCSICLESMTKKTAYKVDCNHVFHRKCIREWLAKQHTCPICRVYILLPDEFPALGD